MSYRDELRADPYQFDFFQVLREFERSSPQKPRIGESTVLDEDIITLGQDPFLEFPASNVTGYEERENGAPRLRTRFLGFFGPQGALPLTTTIEAYSWQSQRDPSFVHFTDILASRFQQLFYRAWADSRPIAQHERPETDRFFAFVGSFAGIGSEPFRNRDSIDDIAKVGFAGLVGTQIKSASRLRQLLRGIFKADVEIIERVGSWLTFEPEDRMAVGQQGSGLGVDSFVGNRSHSINDKIRIRIAVDDLELYQEFLPTGGLSEKLTDLVYFYLGHRFDFDVELALLAELAPPVKLGESGQLGWTSWVSPGKPEDGEKTYLSDARFAPMERRRAAAEAQERGQASGKKPTASRTGG